MNPVGANLRHNQQPEHAKMRSDDYIPAEDAEFRTWLESFANGIASKPHVYMLSQAQADSITEVAEDFFQKYATASNVETRTKASIIAKSNSRHVAESLCRMYAMQIKENVGISDEDKVNIGVRPINPSREPIECPQSWPVINVLGNTPGTQTLKYIDSVTEEKAKPFGATELQLFVAITANPDAPLSEARFYGKFTRNPIAVSFDEGDDGKCATYYARWVSARGEHGPWSLPATMRIAA